jgi:hypothetical protein
MLYNRRFRIYIHDDISRPYVPLQTKWLYKVLTLNWHLKGAESGIAPELVEKIYNDYEGLSIKFSPCIDEKKLKLLYLSVSGSDEEHDLIRILSALNSLTEIDSSIACPGKWHEKLRPYANDNIRFIPSDRGLKRYSAIGHEYNLVITFGPGALHFIRQGIPVLVAGTCGYGGIVNPDNFSYHLREGFMGRPGGKQGEPIPAGILQEDLSSLKLTPEMEGRLVNTKDLALPLDYKPLSKINESVAEAKLLKSRLFDEKVRWSLKPRLASNMTIIKKDELLYIKRSFINDILAVVNKQTFPLLDKMAGTLDFSALQRISNMEARTFWKYMYMLWQKKIIVF